MKIHQWLALITALLHLTAWSATRPNVLLIITDNQSPGLLGAYGNRDILTPNIDRLATEGLLFEQAYATSGVCSPTRATLLTGLLPSQTGVHNGLPGRFKVENWSAIEEFRNLPQTLADAGYRRVCLVVGPGPDAVREHYERQECRRLQLEFAEQAEPKGTADAVVAAADFVGDEPFLVINADNHYPAAALAALRPLNGPGLIGYTREGLEAGGIPSARVSGYAVIETDAEDYLSAIMEKPEPAAVARMDDPIRVSMNCWRFDADVVASCRTVSPSSRGELELPDAVRNAMRERGVRFRVVTQAVPVLDLSSRADIGPVTSRLQDVEVRL